MLIQEPQNLFKLEVLIQILIGQSLFVLMCVGYLAHGLSMDLHTMRIEAYVLIILVGGILSARDLKGGVSSFLPMDVVAINAVASRNVLTIFFLMVVGYISFPEPKLPFSAIIMFSASYYIALVVLHRPLSKFFLELFRLSPCSNALVVGSSLGNEKVRRWIQSNISLKTDCHYYCWSDRNQESVLLNAEAIAHLEDMIKRCSCRQLLISETPRSMTPVRQLLELCDRRGIRLLVVNDLHERFGHSLCLRNFAGLQVIGLRKEPLSDPVNRLIKRTLDLAIALPSLVVTLPLYALIAAVHRVQSPGPLLFVQRRSGLGNHEFNILKFRSLHVENQCPSKQVERHDERVFPIGRILRRYSIDELPQLINVLKGEMSLVGPRPHMVEHNEEFEGYLSGYNVRTLVKPGITGLAQVRGYRGETRSREQIEKRIQSDVFYLENWTFALDILIILRTFVQLVKPPKNAY